MHPDDIFGIYNDLPNPDLQHWNEDHVRERIGYWVEGFGYRVIESGATSQGGLWLRIDVDDEPLGIVDDDMKRLHTTVLHLWPTTFTHFFLDQQTVVFVLIPKKI